MACRGTAILWLILLPVAAMSATGDLATDVEQILRERYLDDGGEYAITIPRTAALPEGGYDDIQVTPTRNVALRGNFPIKVSFIRDGLVVRSANLAIYIGVFRDVLVASRRIHRSEPLTASMFTSVRRDVADFRQMPLTSLSQIEEKCAARTINKGKVLTEPMVDKLELVHRGDMVKIEIDQPAFKLTASGEARQAGGRGDLIKVRNISSNKTIIAEVMDDQTVKIVE